MSLQTDIIFSRALHDSEAFSSMVDGRIYNTAIPLPDEEIDNVPLPYAIVAYDGMVNDASTKDDPYEGDYDTVTISVLLVAGTRPKLSELSETARVAIHDFFANLTDDDQDYDLVPIDYTLSAQGVMYDQFKPSYWLKLIYQCYTNV